MLTPREKSPLPEKKFSLEEDQTHDPVSSRTSSPTHYQRAIPAHGGNDDVLMSVVVLVVVVCGGI